MRQHLPRISLVLVTATLIAAAATKNRGFQADGYSLEPVAGSVQLLTGPFAGNIGLSIGDDGVLVVDTQLKSTQGDVQKMIERASKAPVRYLVNTHWHWDHTGGNDLFGDSAAVIAHTNVRQRLVDNPNPEAAPESMPSLTYEEAVTLHMNGETVRVWHVGPAHTDGDSVVLFEGSNVLHMGDLYFNGLFPFIDLESGGDVAGYVAAVGAVLERTKPDTKVIPGHGGLSTVAELRAYHAMLVETTERVKRALGEGKTAAQMAAENLLDGYTDLSWQFISTERFLETLAQGLAQ